MTDLDTFLADLASDAPVPGGGSVAAFHTAMAAALLCMVANLTIGRKRYAAVEAEARAIRDGAGELQMEARHLIDEDAAAYGAVSSAATLPRDTDEDKRSRSAAMQHALKGAALPPLATMQIASRIIGLAGELVAIGNRSAVSDVGTAAGSALAGYEAARLNVEINLAAVRDADWVSRTRNEMDSIEKPQVAVQAIMRRVESIIRGEA